VGEHWWEAFAKAVVTRRASLKKQALRTIIIIIVIHIISFHCQFAQCRISSLDH
jgi:hypothetical protein